MFAFLFGAGASAFSGECSPSAPPLGDDLFDEIVSAGLLPESFPVDLIPAFKVKGGFESAMATLADRNSQQYMPFLRSMALFFCRFVPGEENLYRLFFSGLLGTGTSFGVATLNYENLIECALDSLGVSVHGGNIKSAQACTVIKPHGSCGFLPQLGGITMKNVSFQGCQTDVEGLPVICTINGPDVERWCNSNANASIAPTMSFYADGKPTKINSGYIDQHRQAWEKICTDANVCFLVGLRCNPKDAHVWNPLSKSNAQLVYINPVEDDRVAFHQWAEDVKKTSVESWNKKFSRAIPFIVLRAQSARRLG